MAKKPNPAASAEDQNKQKTAAADDNASGSTSPATGNEGAGAVGVGGAVAPSTETQSDPKTLTVRGPVRGRWRAGMLFGPDPVDVEISSLTDDQLLSIHGDPELTVVRVE